MPGKSGAQTAWATVRARPALLVLPVLVLSALLVGGSLGLQAAVRRADRKAQSQVEDDALEVMIKLQNFIMSALVPAYQFRSYVEQHPQKSGLPALQQELQRVAHSMVLQERRQVGKQLKWVEVTFQGRMVLVEPQDHPDASTILQYDLLRPQPLLPLSVRTDAVTALRTLKLVMQDRARSMDGESSVVALLPMFVRANASEAAAWGFDEAPECAAGTLPCYDPQIGWAWWGTISVVFDTQELMRSALAAFKIRNPAIKLVQQRLAGSDIAEAPVELSQSANWPEGGCSCAGTWKTNISETSQWTVHLCDTSGHHAWKIPAAVAVVLGSVLLASLVLAFATRWARRGFELEVVFSKGKGCGDCSNPKLEQQQPGPPTGGCAEKAQGMYVDCGAV